MNNLKEYGATERHFAEAALYPELCMARVVSQYKDLYKIVTDEGEGIAEVSGKFRYEAGDADKYPAVGDFVMTDRGDDSTGNAIIHCILTRKSTFGRIAAGGKHRTQLVATNIDIVFICMALNNDYNLSRLERYLSVAWSSGATPVVVLTKADLCGDLEYKLCEISRIALGSDIHAVSSHNQESCNVLLDYLKPGVTASFIGSSGVGKSTLINKLAGEELLATSETRQDDKGRHTTTRRELLVLPQGGVVIDSPGMRELGVDTVELSETFADIDEITERCRFDDCTHTAEPGCAIQRSLEDGSLDLRRWESYQKLKKEAQYEGLSSKQIETEKLNSMFGDIGGMKKMRKSTRMNDKRKY